MSDNEPDWEEASPEVINLAEKIIYAHHPFLRALNICFVFRKEPQKNKGREILGQVTKVPEKFKPFMEFDFMIWLARDAFEAMSSRQREAIIDHELCHIQLRNGSYTLVGHDFEEFYEIIQRYGLWDERLRRVDRELTSHQMSLSIEVENSFSFSGMGRVGTVTKEQLSKMETANP